MSAKPVNAKKKKLYGSSFNLQIDAELQQNIFIYEADTSDKKWITYDYFKTKRSWSNCGDPV